MKKTLAKLNGNLGIITLVGWFGVFATFATFWFSCSANIDNRIDERINNHPKIDKIDHQSELNGFNIKRMMDEFDIEYIE